MNQEKIGKFIAELRKEKNLTQEELATKLGITKNAVSKWERGLSMMDVSLFKPVCEILGISIVELLNGEKIKDDDINNKTEDTIKNTIEYSNKKIKVNRIKNIICTLLVIIALCIGLFFGYQLLLLNKYTLKKPDNVSDIVSGLKNQKEIKIHKRTIQEDDYFYVENFRIRNDFEDYKLTNTVGKNMAIRSYTYKSDNYGITIGIGNDSLTLDNVFAADEVTFFSDENSKINPKAFNSADRKFFLLKNDINNEVDFYQFVANNYYKKNHIFMDKRTMMENYAFNLFTSITVPKVDEFIILKGDYQGYVFKIFKDDMQSTQITILRDGEVYGLVTNDPRFKDDDYLIDIIGTIDIR